MVILSAFNRTDRIEPVSLDYWVFGVEMFTALITINLILALLILASLYLKRNEAAANSGPC